MAQTTNVPTQEDFFMPEWPATWAPDQHMGFLENQPGPRLFAEATPMLSTQDIAATNDIRR